MMASEIQNKGGVQKKQVRVGVGVLVKDPKRNGHIFAGIRQGSHGSGLLALPGGHLELMETWEDCAKREVEEETGLQVVDVNFLHVTNDPMPSENKHYITIFMAAKCNSKLDEPVNLEPQKCEGWSSFSWNDLQETSAGMRKDLALFGPLKHLVEQNPQRVLDFLGSADSK